MREYKSRDRRGEVFGDLTVKELVPSNGVKGNKVWICECSCGSICQVRVDHLRDGSTKSCGCKKKEKLRKSATYHGHSYDLSLRSEYMAWVAIKRRCYNPKAKQYPNYGGRGITITDRWLGKDGFVNFISDLGKKPTPAHSLDRYPDNNGNYEPSNCRWATHIEQQRNKRDNHLLEYNGEKMVLLDWAKKLNVERYFIYHHLKEKSFPEVVQLIQSGKHRTRKRRTIKPKKLS